MNCSLFVPIALLATTVYQLGEGAVQSANASAVPQNVISLYLTKLQPLHRMQQNFVISVTPLSTTLTQASQGLVPG